MFYFLQVDILHNRTRMLQQHSEALRKAFYLSYIFQRLNKSKEDFVLQPGLQYYYLSQAAELVANPDVLNGSAVFFDVDPFYANYYNTLIFNFTLPLFGPRAYRIDDFDQPYDITLLEIINY